MNCTNCGKPLLANSSICPVCGKDNKEALNNQNTIDNNSQNPQENLEENQTLESFSPNSETTPPSVNISDSTENESNIETTNFIELDDEAPPNITETMAPPTLNIEEENLTAGAGELANESSVSTYSDEALKSQMQEEQAEQTRQEERVDIIIPKVGEVAEVRMPSDGSAPLIETQDTIGTKEDNGVDVLPPPDKKKKFKLSLAKGSKSVPKALMIIVAIIFLVVGVLLGKMFFSKNICRVGTTSNSSVINNKKIKYVSDGKNNTTNINGVTYKIPEQYTFDKRENGLLIYGENDTFRIYLKIEDGLYQDLTGAKNSIKASMVENSINISNVKELKEGDVEFLVFETTTRLTNRMIAFASASESKVYYLEIVNATNNYDYNVLDVAADIIKNASYEDVVSNMEKVDIEDIADVSIKAALEYKNLTSQ